MSTAFTNPYAAPWGKEMRTLMAELGLAYTEHYEALQDHWWRKAIDWDDETVYASADYCIYSGELWRSLQGANLNHAPDESGSTWWQKVFPVAYIEQTPARAVYATTWSHTITYSAAAMVSFHGKRWISKQNGNTGNNPDEEDSEWWQEDTVKSNALVWHAAEIYWINFRVWHDGRLWYSIQETNVGHLPDAADSEWWKSDISTTDLQGLSGALAKMQNFIETECVHFVNHDAGPLKADKSDFLYFTPATFRSLAGLEAGGFRRARDWTGRGDPTWLANGTVQRGDVIGPWTIEDLQKAFSVLRQTVKSTPTGGKGQGFVNAEAGYGGTCEEAKASWEAYWAAAVWYGSSTVYSVYARQGYWPPNHSRGGGRRRWIDVVQGGIGAIERTADVYVLPVMNSPLSGATFYDVDGMGLVENELSVFESFAASLASHYIYDLDDKNATEPIPRDPFVVLEWGCPWAEGRNVCAGIATAHTHLKWNFTYQNA